MRAIGALAGTTLRELTRNKLFYNLLIFALLFISASLLLASLSIGQWGRIITDVGLATVELAAVLIASVIGASMLAGEIERRTLYVVLAKPVSRAEFVLGKYAGLLSAVVVNVAVQALAIVAVLRLAGWTPNAATWAALLLTLVEAALLASFALLFSAFSTPTLSATFTLAIFAIGHLSDQIAGLGAHAKSRVVQVVSRWCARTLPNLTLLNVKPQAANMLPVSGRYVAAATAYGLAYAAIVLLVAIAVFQRRDLR